MANDRYRFLVLEESLPEGTITEHRKARSKAKRPIDTKRRPPSDRAVIPTSARAGRAGRAA
jgi:hypothetical protein